MLLIYNDSPFRPVYHPHAEASEDDLVFFYNESKIGLTARNELPTVKELFLGIDKQNFFCFGLNNNQQCLLANADDVSTLNFVEAKTSHKFLPIALYQAVAIGSHMYHWRSTHRYCGKCAGLMLDKGEERALVCSECDYLIYPKISPCVIVLVTHRDKLLLARSPHFPPGVMSTLAGFIEVGESVEQTLVREVQEEVGIHVTNLKYICSQPWPFPDSLMLGFTAEYVSGEIKINKNEIEAAGWFDKNSLPTLPNKMSIARYLIERCLE